MSALIAVVVGVIVGALAGYFGGWLDTLLMRVAEFFQTLPRFVVALIVIALFGTSVFKMIVVIAALSGRNSRAWCGRRWRRSRNRSSSTRRAWRAWATAQSSCARYCRTSAAPIIVLGSLDIAMAILIEASLSFFGLGDPNHVSWGAMLNDAQQYLRSAWWMSAFPGLGDRTHGAVVQRLRRCAE